MPSVVTASTAWESKNLSPGDYMIETGKLWAPILHRAAQSAKQEGVTLSSAHRDHLPVAELWSLIEEIRGTLRRFGFVLVRGWPGSEYGDETAYSLYWVLGAVLGQPLPQNAAGDRLYKVTDTSPAGTSADSAARGSTSNEELVFHTDSASATDAERADILGLFCIRAARSGGDSLLASGHTLYNTLLKADETLVSPLFGDVPFGRRSETYAGGLAAASGPVFRSRGDALLVRYNRYWIDMGFKTLMQEVPPSLLRSLNAVDEVLSTPAFGLRFRLAPGDVLLADNTVVMHGRAEFNDYEELDRRRLLLRLWIKSPTDG